MKLHHIRNATLVFEQDDIAVIVDPMLGPKGSQPPFSFFRHRPRFNPTVDLPAGSEAILSKVNHCVITHRHPDHIDRHGQKFLIDQNIPVLCGQHDHELFRGRGLYVTHAVKYHEEEPYLGGSAVGIEARHGYGWIASVMGKVMGFFLKLPSCPSIYLSSDTVFTDQVANTIAKYQPDICVLAAGMARLDLGQPLLMHMDDIAKFVRAAPKHVIANHMEAINHCPLTRKELRRRLADEDLLDKVWIPEDGENKAYELDG